MTILRLCTRNARLVMVGAEYERHNKMNGITKLACVVCGETPTMIFAVHKDSASGFCSPQCAARLGLEPWVSSDIATRSTWPEHTA